MTRSLRIAVADDEQFMRDYFAELLPRLGHQIVTARDGRQLLQQCRELKPDLVITDIKMPDMDGLAAAEAINRERHVPVILVSAYHDEELRARALQGHVMAYLAKPVRQEDLQSAIDLAMLQFEQNGGLRQEAAELKQALEDRKTVERAKGIVMRRLHLDEAEAFRRMRKLSSDRNLKVTEIARQVLTAEETYRALDG